MARTVLPRWANVVIGLLLAVALWGIGTTAAGYITPDGIVVHHSASAPEASGLRNHDALARAHSRRGFGLWFAFRYYSIGYHYVIWPDGVITQGRPEHARGAHASGHNSTLGICLVGNFDGPEGAAGAADVASPTNPQMRGLVQLTQTLMQKYNLGPAAVFPHRRLNVNTACPGRGFPWNEFVSDLARPEARPRQ